MIADACYLTYSITYPNPLEVHIGREIRCDLGLVIGIAIEESGFSALHVSVIICLQS